MYKIPIRRNIWNILFAVVVLIFIERAALEYYHDTYRRDSSYVLSSELQSASAVLLFRESGPLSATYQSQGRILQYRPPNADYSIVKKAAFFGGTETARLFFASHNLASHRLTFKVPGEIRKLRLFLGFSDLYAHTDDQASFSLSIFWNQKGLFTRQMKKTGMEALQTIRMFDLEIPKEGTSLAANELSLELSPSTESKTIPRFFVDGYLW